MTDWTVYRDGVALLVSADTLHDALYMTVDASALPLVLASAAVERELVGALRVDSGYADDRRVDVVYKIDERVFEVERVDPVDLFRAVLAWVGARREYARARASWHKQSCEGVRFDRAGVPKFKRADDSRKRARVLAAVRSNELSTALVEGASDMLASARDVFDVADPSWAKLDPRDASELRELLAEKGGQARNAFGKTHSAALERALSCVRSVELVGMGVGCPVAVLPSGFADDPSAGPGVVIDVHPLESTRNAQYHSREVRMRDGVELSISTNRLALN